jgi:parvulin-like peptidyl-prolyl isomerase
MQRRRDDRIRDRIARIRGRAGGKPVAPARVPARKPRIPRREREARRQRLLRWGLAIAGIALVAILAGGILYDNVIKPNQTLASVGSVSISRQDYWKARANDLYEQALQYQDFAQFVGPDQQNQYLSLAQQSLAEVPEVWGSTEVDSASLEKMIDNQIYLQGLEDLGLQMTPEEIHTFALNRFAPPGAPLIPASPTPTLTAERAEMATSTAAALLATPLGSPVAATPVAATPVSATPLATPVGGNVAATPLALATPVAVATPNADEARATAEAGFSQFEEALFPVAHLSPEEYERLVAAPELARQKVRDALAASVGQSAPQVRAAHILVPSREDADAVRARITEGGEAFADVAREVSTDQATGANGGELGWFVREEMVPPFADAAFTQEPGNISEPVESEFGWHIIQVEENDPDRPLTDAQINRIQEAIADRWLEEQRAALDISSSLPVTPTPFAQGFQPPVGAPPPPPPPTPLPAVTSPEGPPGGASVIGTPSG